jgi:hypothetical protein
LIFDPLVKCRPGEGDCEITRPFRTFFEAFFFTCPTPQYEAKIDALALESDFRITFGTMHWAFANVAVTVVSAVSVNWHAALFPEHPAPDHPAKTEPAAGDSTSVTCDPHSQPTAQTGTQLSCESGVVLTTVPKPGPDFCTVTSYKFKLKVAVTAVSLVIATWQGSRMSLLQLPTDQLEKTECAPGVAVSATSLPIGNLNEHVAPQSMPAGELVTVPDPEPAAERVSVSSGVVPVVASSKPALLLPGRFTP